MHYLKLLKTNNIISHIQKCILLMGICMLSIAISAQSAVVYSERNIDKILGTIEVEENENHTFFSMTTVYAEDNECLEEDETVPILIPEFDDSIVNNKVFINFIERAVEEQMQKTAEEEAIRQAELMQQMDEEARANGTVKEVPAGRGKTHTFMGWQCITCESSSQYRLRTETGENYDENGFAKVGDRYVVATKPYYGTIGDYIDVIKTDGEIIKCVIGDQKGSDGGGDMYGHADGSIIEFVVDRNMWYSGYNGLGRYLDISTYHPSWTSNNIDTIINVGNYWS